jgi:hypothetical protein
MKITKTNRATFDDIERFEVQKLDKASRRLIAALNPHEASIAVVEIAIITKGLTPKDRHEPEKLVRLRNEGRLRIIDKATGEVYYHCDVEKGLVNRIEAGNRVCIINRTTGEAIN